ncbi:hypothetical protein DERF_009388 [Dermatophagoides farinae]|uniref:Uncharacterized protein n=1 Tax=Dermatophagoides farinae TaxID=6954 RepID=A0A922HWB9_DERFA|nr:hypothetical protein DERF_009388 [Dermatophagoides farinae]
MILFYIEKQQQKLPHLVSFRIHNLPDFRNGSSSSSSSSCPIGIKINEPKLNYRLLYRSVVVAVNW